MVVLLVPKAAAVAAPWPKATERPCVTTASLPTAMAFAPVAPLLP